MFSHGSSSSIGTMSERLLCICWMCVLLLYECDIEMLSMECRAIFAGGNFLLGRGIACHLFFAETERMPLQVWCFNHFLRVRTSVSSFRTELLEMHCDTV